MPWMYRQSTGELSHHGKVIDKQAYSGHGAGKNNPTMQSIRAVGPIPQGIYRIGAPRHSPEVGDFAMKLTPEADTQTFGRDAFFIHGDSHRRSESALEASLVVSAYTRHLIWSSGDHQLKVVG